MLSGRELGERGGYVIWGALLGGIAVVNPQSATLKLGLGALVRGPMQPGGPLPRVPHVRGWLWQWAPANGRRGRCGGEVGAAATAGGERPAAERGPAARGAPGRGPLAWLAYRGPSAVRWEGIVMSGLCLGLCLYNSLCDENEEGTPNTSHGMAMAIGMKAD